MTDTGMTLGITYIVVGLLFTGLSIPLILRKVKMNHLYGVRIPKSFESEEDWYRINEYGGRQLVIWSTPIVLLGIVLLFVPLPPRGPLTTAFELAPIVFVLVPLIRVIIWARSL